jgi:uncharacterized protein HemY
MNANQSVEQIRFNYCFLFAGNFISELLLVVGQILITKWKAFGFDVNNWHKMERRKRAQYWTQIKN